MKSLLKFLLVLLWLFSVLQSYAQNEKMSVGIKFMPGLSKSNGELIETSGKISVNSGISYVVNFTNVIGMETGLSFRNYGYTNEVTLTNEIGQPMGTFNVRFNYNYISLPVLLRIYIKSFYIAPGANMNFLISAKSNTGESMMVSGEEQSGKQDIENVKTIVVEPEIILGYQFSIKDKFGINLEVSGSFTANGIWEGDNAMKIRNIGLGVGFFYFIKPKS